MARLLAETVRSPVDALERVRTRIAREREHPFLVSEHGDWHGLLPRSIVDHDAEFAELWSRVIVPSGVDRHDSGSGLAAAAYAYVRSATPERVVETGVARGVTTRVILEALERNGAGELWSIDLPPGREDLGAARDRLLPRHLHARWQLLVGSSRRRLPGLLDDLGWIDLFVHDSAHTERNMLFEMETAWTRLQPGGWLLADDVGLNRGFDLFLRRHSPSRWTMALEPEKGGAFGVVVR